MDGHPGGASRQTELGLQTASLAFPVPHPQSTFPRQLLNVHPTTVTATIANSGAGPVM
jgi:hypothetical protein